MARLSVMGILTAWRIGSQVRPTTLASPWSDGQLSEFVMSDVFGDIDELPLTRAAAMRVPAVAKGRNLLVSAIANLPMVQLTIDGRVPTQPGWMSKTRGISTWQRMAWTVDDLIFYGASIWEVERGADGSILTADRVPTELWKVTDGAILIDDKPVDESQVLYIPGPHEGILTQAAATIRGGRDLENAWQARVKNPIPAAELRETMEAQLSPSEVQSVIDAWAKARKSPNGAVAYTPHGYELIDHGATDAALFEDGRNAVRTDIGAHLNIDASLLDAAVQQSSLTYKTAAGERSAFLTYSVPFWTNPIETRLSMDDVVPRGSRTRLDMSELLAATATPTGAPTED